MSVNGYVGWSIYVRTSNKRKLLDAHLPPINAALEKLDFEWQIITEPENAGLFRLINYQNLQGATVAEVVLPVLRRAYRLGNEWKIGGLGDLYANALRHVYGYWRMRDVSDGPPALDSILFEMDPGQVGPMNSEGGWPVEGRSGSVHMAPDATR